MSAIVDSGDINAPIQVLFVLHDGFDTLDFTGPMEAFCHARHEAKKPETAAFKYRTCGASNAVKSAQGLIVKVDMDFEDAEEELEDVDILVIPGGGSQPILDSNTQPQGLIKAWSALQTKDPSKERTLFSVCTGSLFLAQAGVLQGLSATTHPDYYWKLEQLCQEATAADSGVRTNVEEERYVVNNGRFNVDDDRSKEEYIYKAADLEDPSVKVKYRKGSDAWKISRRRESLVKRAAMPLGGLRVITSGGVTAGIDAALYLVAAHVDIKVANEVARVMQFYWQKGLVMDKVDV